MRIDILKYMQSLIYYSTKLAKLAPNALKTAKKCEFVKFKPEMISIKIPKASNTSQKS